MILALLIQVAVAPSAPATRPNVVLIIADDQAWTDFGFMDHDVIRTPHLDELARQSAFFPRAYVPTSLCRPSLATMITGLYPHQHGLTGNDPPDGVDRERMLAHIANVETLPEILGRAGYASLQTGKWWEGDNASGGFTEGMTHGDPARGGRHGDEGLAIGRETMAPIFTFLDECAESETPFFLWYAPFLPHRPHDPPARLLAKYEQPGRPASVAKYQAMCEWFDETCGTLLDALDERGLAGDTLVLFASDNGWIQDPGGPGYAPRSKRTAYEGGVRTPILVRWPGVVTPGVYNVPVSTIDLAPTVLAACGQVVPAAMPGASLLDVGGADAPERGPVFGASFTHDVVDVNEPARSLLARWVVDGRWKLVATRAPEPQVELFDLEADPHETREVSEANPERVAALAAAIDTWWPAEVPARPNVLFLLTDDQRADAMGSAGHPFLATPSMDSLAARGVRFTNAFVTTSICAASRASILTSLHERAHGYTFGTPPITDSIAKGSYPSLLRAAGYRTGFVGKWGVKIGKSARDRMFDMFRPLGTNPYMKERPDGSVRHLTDITADEAIAFLESAAPGGSFCLSVSFNAPHAEDGDPRQYIWPPALDGLYDDEPIPPPPLFEPAFFDAQPEFLRKSLGRTRYGWRFDTEQKRVDMTRGYYRMITGVDRAIARILAALDSLELADDTVVIFSSDNGYFLGERGFAGKWLIYEDSVRVPLIVFDPRAAADRRGKTEDAMALNVDIAPTILDLAGVEAPASYQGTSLVPLLRGEDPPWRADFFYEHLFDHPAIPKSRGVRGERWVYVQYFEQDPIHEELYDLVADPHEAHDLAHDPEHAAILATMRARCAELAAAREP
ncbi:MAG: DUF4976 domain-containing protein [Planctomycetota bacterium]|nr:MAG: DUF4976 domain-containing protein [Planctomycetota bacterium]